MVHTTLLTAKTKVVPLKQKISLPRLELCGALMLANLLKSTITSLEINSPTVFAWCDSEITLAWIAKNPNTWHTYVANRVSEIQRLLPNNIWRHVPSLDNPADIASRGISPKKLAAHNTWWKGPLWLSKSPEAWPRNKENFTTQEDNKPAVQVLTTQVSSTDILKCSTFTRQTRTIAYCRRFIKNCKTPRSQRNTEYLTSQEIKEAKTCIIKIVQQEAFYDETKMLKKNKPLMKSSKLLSLNPFLDSEGILRVGGRIDQSKLSADARHQILLPQKHHVTNIIIDHAHKQTLHGGTQLTLNYIRSQYWVISAKRVVQSRIHRCIVCLRHRQQSTQQLMGDLPAVRITPSPPFSHCGIDYAGPFVTKMSKGRGTKTLKGYISLFICMATKAVHLELVSDLTTDAFLAAFRRFVARRGNPKQIFSDNGTNFVGANNKLQKELIMAIKQSTKHAAEITANEGTEWNFIPPATPHFGGLWEAGIKSVKTHLKRVLGETLLTYEEFTTVIYQVEACLNSRPIGQHSCDPRDLEPLTPGHFIIGRALLSPPQPDITDQRVYDRWRQLTKFQQDIWQRWSEEYLALLQQRSKWRTTKENPSVGELVLVKDENLPPQKWLLGRIVQLHPGEDNVVRLVSVQHKNGIKKRALNKLCQLPIDMYNTESKSPEHKTTATFLTTNKTNNKPTTRKRVRATVINHEAELWSSPEDFDKIKMESSNKVLEPPRRKKIRIAPCTWATKLLHTTLFILYWLTTIMAQEYEILQPKTGFYIEKLGHAQVKRGNLRLQINFPMDEITHDKEMIDNTWTKIQEICKQNKRVTDITHCDALFQHISTTRRELTKAIDQIIQLTQGKNRRKRGVLGKLLTSVFGVNDEIYSDIEHLQHNQENLLQSTNQQVLFLNQKINQSNSVIEEKLRHFESRLTLAMSSIKEMSTWYVAADHNRISIEVMSTYISAENYLNEIRRKYDRWLNALHEHAHLLDFITPHDINEVIRNVSDKLGSNLFITGKPQHRLEVNTENGTIKLYGYLSIVERGRYDLLHVTSMPQIITNNSFVIAELKYPTFAVDYDKQSYFILKEEELKACSITSNHNHLCTPTIVYSIDDSPSCVIDEIYSRHTTNNCEMRHIQLTGTIWKTLMMKNTWLYITTKPKVVAVICNGARRELILNGTGIIHLRDECFIKTKELTLKTTIDQQFDVIESHIKEIAPLAATINFTEVTHILQPEVLIRPNEQMLDYSVQPELLRMDEIHKSLAIHSVVATTSFLISFILAIIVYKYWVNIKELFKNHSCRRRLPPSNRRRQSTPNMSIQTSFNKVLAAGAPQHVQART